jgi:cytochrome P450 family 6
LIFWIKKQFRYWKDKGFEYLEPEFLFGNIRSCGTKTRVQEIAANVYNEYKGRTSIVGIYFYTVPSAIITSVELAKTILVSQFDNFNSRGIYVNLKDDPLSGILFSLEGLSLKTYICIMYTCIACILHILGSKWKHMRQKLTPVFSSGKIKAMFGTVRDISTKLIEHLVNREPAAFELDAVDIFTRYTTDVIANIAFGLEVNSLEQDQNSLFRDMTLRFINPPKSTTLKHIFVNAFQRLSKFLRLRYIDEPVSDFFMSTVRQTVEYREKNEIFKNDFFNSMLELKNYGRLRDEVSSDVVKITFDELAAQSFSFIVAGEDLIVIF